MEDTQKASTHSKTDECAYSREPMYRGEHCVIDGDAAFGDETSLWHNATIRTEHEPVRIGARTNIQDGCVIHTDAGYPVTIGENVTVGHGAIVHGATIEDGALIGMGAILLNGCVIKKGAVVGAGAVVGEKKVIEANTLALGVPARPVRDLGENHWQEAMDSAAHYVDLAYQKRKETRK